MLYCDGYNKDCSEVTSEECDNGCCDSCMYCVIWIRINWGDIYIFLCDNGSIGYQVDPLGAYGSELIDMWDCTENDFVKEILSLEAAPIVKDGITFFEAEESVNEPPMYIPMK